MDSAWDFLNFHQTDPHNDFREPVGDVIEVCINYEFIGRVRPRRFRGGVKSGGSQFGQFLKHTRDTKQEAEQPT